MLPICEAYYLKPFWKIKHVGIFFFDYELGLKLVVL